MKINRKIFLIGCNKGFSKLLMKSLIFLFCALSFGFSPREVHSQNTKVFIDMDKTISISEVLELLKTQTDYKLIYVPEQLINAPSISVKKGFVEISTLLKSALLPIKCNYILSDNTIIIRKDIQSSFTISGQVFDSKGQPLPGITVYTSSSSPDDFDSGNGSDFVLRGSITDFEGVYKLEVDIGDYLIARGLNYKQFVTTIDSVVEKYNIVLEEKVNQLDEVVLSGYQRLSKERSAGSFVKADESDIGKRNDFDVINSIETLLPGVLVSDAPDGTRQISIRGTSTFNADTRPLVVVDGFPITRDIETINQNDVKSVTVLKDASAASIWGVRAANGVIVIETKRNSNRTKSKLDIDFKQVTSIATKPDFNGLPVAPTSSFIEFERYKAENGLVLFLPGVLRNSLSPVTDAIINNPSQADQIIANIPSNLNSRHEFDNLFRHSGISTQYGINISGQGVNSNHKASFSYDKLETEFIGNDTERFVGDLYESFWITPKFKVDLGLNYVVGKEKNNGMGYDDLRFLLPYQKIVGDSGQLVAQPFGYYQEDKDNFVNRGLPYDWDYNLLREKRNKDNKINSSIITSTVRLQYDLSKALSVEAGYMYELGKIKGTNLYDENTYFTRDIVNRNATDNGLGTDFTLNIPKGAILEQNYEDFYSHTLRGILHYDDNIINDDHFFSAILGGEIRETGLDQSEKATYGYSPETLQSIGLNNMGSFADLRGVQTVITDNPTFTSNKNRFVSYFFNVGYTYKDKYSLNGSYRLDKTNLLGNAADFRDVGLWSVGASWQIHKELDSDQINRLLLRASYGLNGNIDRSTSPFLIANISTSSTTNQQFASISNPANPLLQWERTAVTNMGLDFAFFGNRLSGTVEYYKRVSTDLLGNSQVNGTYGFDSAFINFGSMENVGVETSMTGVIFNKGFNWKSTINFSTNKNEVTKVDLPQESVNVYLNGVVPIVGNPLNYLYSLSWAGLSTEGSPQVLDENGDVVDYNTQIGDVAALNYEGTTTPKYYGSFLNEFNYKNFSLLTNFSYTMGHKFRIPTIQYEKLIGNSETLLHKDWDKRWQQPGDEDLTDVPSAPTDVLGLATYDSYVKNSNNKIASASTIRFRELLFSYSIPKPIFNSTISLGLQVRNLAVVNFNKADLDPDYLYVDNSSLSIRSFTPPTEYSVSIKANF